MAEREIGLRGLYEDRQGGKEEETGKDGKRTSKRKSSAGSLDSLR